MNATALSVGGGRSTKSEFEVSLGHMKHRALKSRDTGRPCDLSLQIVDVPYYQMNRLCPAGSELCKAGFQAELTQLQGDENALELPMGSGSTRKANYTQAALERYRMAFLKLGL